MGPEKKFANDFGDHGNVVVVNFMFNISTFCPICDPYPKTFTNL